MAWVKEHNLALYKRFDALEVRDKVQEIRNGRRKAWRRIVLPKECHINNLGF